MTIEIRYHSPKLLVFIILMALQLTIMLTVRAQELFVIDNGNSRLYKIDKNVAGTNQILLSTLPTPKGIAVDPDNGDIYYTDGSTNPTNGRILRVNKDGTNQTVVATGLNSPTALALDPIQDKLYFIQRVSLVPSIFSVSTSGSPLPVLLVSGITTNGPIDLDIDTTGAKIYWTDSRGASIRRATTAGLSEETLVDNLAAPLSGIAVDSTRGFVYWVNEVLTQIQYVALSDTAPATPSSAITDSLLTAGGLAVDGSQTPTEFFIARNSSKVLKATFNGSVTELLGVSQGAAQPTDIGFYNLPLPTPTATSTPVPESPILTPGTQLLKAPIVTVSGRKATITLRNFISASKDLVANLYANSTEIAGRAETRASNPLIIRYDVKIVAAKKKDNQKLLSKRNQLTLKGLKPGNYSASYSAVAYTKKTKAQIQKAKSKGKTGFTDTHKKVFSTNFSPSAVFTILK